MTIRRPIWQKSLLLALLVVLVIYPLSIGPFIWLDDNGYVPASAHRWTVRGVYRPVMYLWQQGPEVCRSFFDWYVWQWSGMG